MIHGGGGSHESDARGGGVKAVVVTVALRLSSTTWPGFRNAWCA